MVHHKRNVILSILAQIDALRDETSNKLVIPFRGSFLVRSIRIAIENPGSSDTGHRIELNGHGIGELAAVIRKAKPEDTFEFIVTQALVKTVKDIRNRFGRIGVPQESQHHFAFDEMDGQQNLAAFFTFD